MDVLVAPVTAWTREGDDEEQRIAAESMVCSAHLGASCRGEGEQLEVRRAAATFG